MRCFQEHGSSRSGNLDHGFQLPGGIAIPRPIADKHQPHYDQILAMLHDVDEKRKTKTRIHPGKDIVEPRKDPFEALEFPGARILGEFKVGVFQQKPTLVVVGTGGSAEATVNAASTSPVHCRTGGVFKSPDARLHIAALDAHVTPKYRHLVDEENRQPRKEQVLSCHNRARNEKLHLAMLAAADYSPTRQKQLQKARSMPQLKMQPLYPARIRA